MVVLISILKRTYFSQKTFANSKERQNNKMRFTQDDSLTYSDLPKVDFSTSKLRRAIRQMVYDDLLIYGDYGLEYLCPLIGFPYYRLSRCGLLVGIVDVRATHRLPEIHHLLAIYLRELGWIAEQTQCFVFGAQTPLEANKHRIPHLFRVG